MNRIDFKTGFGYAFIHFSMEVLCFFFLYRVFGGTGWWWTIALVYDTVAFAGQVPVGAFCEKHPRFSPGVCGAVLLVTGALIGLAATGCLRPGTANISAVAEGATIGTLAAVAAGAGFVILSIGNAFLHISGALITLKVSQGRLGETGIFVGGGAFGVVTGRLLGSGNGPVWIPFVLMAVSFVLIILLDRVRGIQLSGDVQEPALIPSDAVRDDGIFTDRSRIICIHDHAANRPAEVIILVLAGVIAVRCYISNGIPMQWKKTVFETIMLYVSMGIGKMAGGVLADLFGTRRVGVISCILAVPFLLLGSNMMWISLIGIMLFSMTMAIALGGIVSVLRANPGVAFGITTLALFLGSLPMFFFPMPKGITMNVLLALLSLLSAAGIYFTTVNKGNSEDRRNSDREENRQL